MNLRTLLSDAVAGHRLTPAEGRRLIDATGRDVLAIAAAADEAREERVGESRHLRPEPEPPRHERLQERLRLLRLR